MDDRVEERGEGRRRRRKKAEGKTEPLATISRRVEEEEAEVEENKKEDEVRGERRRGKQQLSVDEGGDVVRKRRTKKKTTKRDSNTGVSDNDENNEERKTKLKKRRKKRQVSLSSQDDYEGGKSEKEKKSKRKSAGGGAHRLREELYADPQLVTTLQGLEDDMFSLSGEGDMTTLSPSPLIPPLPPSQPVAKIYLERGGGFAKTSVAALSAVTTFSALTSSEKQQSPLGLGLATQKIFRSLSIFAHGLLAGLAGWQVFMVYSLHEHDLQFISSSSMSVNSVALCWKRLSLSSTLVVTSVSSRVAQ